MKTFLISDTHFCHNNAYKFTKEDGSLMRPWASNADEGDEIMIENWNKVVADNDKVYHLGDVAIPRRGLQVLGRLKGRKILIKGNHDIFKLHEYAEFFDDIRAVHKLDNLWLSHIPIHPESLRFDGNIHGHLHSNRVKDVFGNDDSRYLCVCVEQINATPIDFESVREKFYGKGIANRPT